MPYGVQRADEAGSLVTLRGVSRRSGLVQVLNRIDLDLPGNRVTALLGPAGAGKTTLCRAVSGSERIDSGSITVAGEQPRRRRGGGVGALADPCGLPAHRTVLQNVVPGRSWLRIRAADGERRGLALLQRVGAAGYAAHYPAELSPEQQLRVAIARAVATGSRLILLDEPAALLAPAASASTAQPDGAAATEPPATDPDLPDPAAAASAPAGSGLPTLLRELAADGLAVLVATGDPSLARATADRVVFMEGGRIIEQGPPEEFFTTPRTARARDFLSAAAKR